MWLAVPHQAPRGLQRPGRGRGGSSLVWLASARVVSEKTRETKEETSGDLVEHYYVVSRCPLISNSTAGADKAEDQPKQGS